MFTNKANKVKSLYKDKITKKKLKKTAISLLSVPLITLFLQYSTPVRTEETDKIKEYEPRYETLAHERLDIESAYKTPVKAYKILDDIISQAKDKIKQKQDYSKSDIATVFETIDSIFKEKGFENKGGSLLGEGLAEKKLDCDRYSFVYLAIAEEMNLPIHAVYVPSHVFVRWDEDKKPNPFNWETKLSKTITNEEYVRRYNVSRENSEKSNYLENLTREEIMAVSYLATGNAFSKEKKLNEAKKNYKKAIKLNPGICITYSNKASIFEKKGDLATAISLYKKAAEINPAREKYYYKLGTLFKEQNKTEEAIEYFTLALENVSFEMPGISSFPGLTDSYLQRGIAFKKKGEFKKALEDFNRAAIQDFTNPDIYKYISIIHKNLGNTEEAQKNLKTYNRLNSGSD